MSLSNNSRAYKLQQAINQGINKYIDYRDARSLITQDDDDDGPFGACVRNDKDFSAHTNAKIYQRRKRMEQKKTLLESYL